MKTELATAGNEPTMSSLDLLEVINQYRLEDGKPEKLHKNFMRDIKDELEEAALNFERSYKGADNTTRPCYNLPKDECMQMAMRESKSVRKRVVKQLNELMKRVEAMSLPDFSNPAIAARAWAEQYEVAQLTSAKLTEATKEIEVKTKKIKKDKPKVESFDKFIDKNMTYSKVEVAKMLGVKPNLFSRRLRAKGVTYKSGRGLPRQNVITGGYMVVKETVSGYFESSEGRFTTKGLLWCEKKFVPEHCKDIMVD